MNIRRGVALVLATLLLAALLVPSLSVSVSAAESGTCGDGLTWSLSAGTLTISGKGTMTQFTELTMAPWYEFRDQIKRVVLPDGLKSIGSLAFYGCKNLKTVYLPDSVTRIGSYAFAGCENLESLRLGDALSVIDAAAFYGCYKLAAVRLPYSLQSLGNQAFYRCESLVTVTVPPYLNSMGTSVFAYCKSLIRAEVSARLGSLPEWTFYGCGKLTVVILPDTVGELENYAFKNCDVLDTVYFDGDDSKKQEIEAGLVKDVPAFEQVGTVSSGAPMDYTTAGVFTEHGDGTVTQQNTTVKSDDNMTFVSVVEHTYNEGSATGGTYTADMTVTVENKEAWSDTVSTVKNTLKDMNDTFSRNGVAADSVELTVYVKTEGGVDTSLVEEMAGRDVKMTVVSQNGSESRIECEELKKEELSGSYDYSYNVEAAPSDKVESLGTEDCFQVKFNESASINSEILVQLPEVPAHSNAYLYQVEDDKTLTRLQATVVDDGGNAHFYLGAVNKDTEYVIGINVPGESSDDAIIPDEMLSHYGDAAERLQKIDYVITGRESSWGLSVAQVTWIMLGVLAVCIIAVGTVMAVWNHRRLKRGYVPDMAEYEDMDLDGSAGAEA
ncbi:MAG: leucine-rich repeat domain-containing protein [Clostridia bacterium]|nr:leucine-rich repeat domain-containing protein [Clostridia bacterium]